MHRPAVVAYNRFRLNPPVPAQPFRPNFDTMIIRRILLCIASLAITTATFAGETDWPQWRGPNRDGIAAPQPLLKEWPAGGPKIKWEFRDAGVGYSGFSIRDKTLFTMGTREDGCYVISIDTNGGKMLWQTKISRATSGEDYAHGWGGGPRSTPTIDGDFVYALSDAGVLACLTADKGEPIWSVDFVADYDGTIPKWGFSESVLIDGDRVIATPGGTSFMVGFDKKTGQEVWKSQGHDNAAQYVSPMKHTVGDVSFYVTASKSGLVAFDTETGKLLFQNAATGNDVAVIPTPIPFDNYVYHTSDYGAGCVLLKLTAGENRTVQAEQVYHESTKSMQNHHGGVVLIDGVIYGATKVSGGAWMAQDVKTGEALWMERMRPNRSGSIAYADGLLYCYNDEEATLWLVEPSRESFKKVSELKLPETTIIDRGSGAIWAHPVIADGTLYLRDQELIFAFDIAR